MSGQELMRMRRKLFISQEIAMLQMGLARGGFIMVVLYLLDGYHCDKHHAAKRRSGYNYPRWPRTGKLGVTRTKP